jgi:hypothetical protein
MGCRISSFRLVPLLPSLRKAKGWSPEEMRAHRWRVDKANPGAGLVPTHPNTWHQQILLADCHRTRHNPGAGPDQDVSGDYSPWRRQRAPRVIIMDKLPSYAAAKKPILPDVEHRRSRYLNN